MIVLGLSGALKHDPSAALVVDGETVAAAEEERFLRDKHAKGKQPLESARFCLEYAGVDPEQIDFVAFPYAPISIFSPARCEAGPDSHAADPSSRRTRSSR
jgi:carbamoyltransferase